MATYISLLRGINVSGQKLIKMEALRETFESLGFKNVRTYVQSGNVIFESSTPRGLAEKIHKRIEKDFGFIVPIIVVTPQDLKNAVRNNPYAKKKNVDDSKLYFTFLSDTPDKELSIDHMVSKNEQFFHDGKVIYLYYKTGYGKAKVTNNHFEKIFKVSATTRNWNTVNELLKMSQE